MAYELQDRAFRLLIDDRNVSYVLVTLAWYADHDKNQCYPSIDTLAKRCHMKRHSVIAAIKTLEDYGILSKQRRYNTSSIYEFSEKFKTVVQKNEDISIEDFILAEEVKVSGGALPPTELKCPEGHSNKVDNNINKVDIKQSTSYSDNFGSISEENQAADLAAGRVLDHYNNKFNSRHKEKKHFVKLLKETKTRGAYTEEDLIMVIDWIAETWSFKPEPIKIARVNRFDEYLAKAEQWRNLSNAVNAADVVEAFNSTFDGLLPFAEMDRDLERKIHRLSEHMKNRNTDSFVNYFDYFRKHAPPFYFGENSSGWIADIDFLLKPETLRKTRNFP
ncbi:helix-turn-helix domain-containing protein [Escherichia coli]|uniref:helix-turn-helix domain-containing protein n=1 Tax=Escherichia coli TaxID=562 RepID=UPI001F1E8C26|nr:helix-turn-helix domain-containing protein [Escherichia coli]